MLLSSEERSRALALPAGLRAANELAQGGVRSAEELLRSAREAMLERGVEPEYLELVDDQLRPVARADARTVVVLAARVGPARLIDNVVLGEGIASDVAVRTS